MDSWKPTLLKNSACQSLGWSPPFLGTVARQTEGWPPLLRLRGARLFRVVPCTRLTHGEPAFPQRGGVKAHTWRGPVADWGHRSSCCTLARNDTVKSHPETRGSGKLKRQFKVLPCVFAGSDVSVTPQRIVAGSSMDCRCTGS